MGKPHSRAAAPFVSVWYVASECPNWRSVLCVDLFDAGSTCYHLCVCVLLIKSAWRNGALRQALCYPQPYLSLSLDRKRYRLVRVAATSLISKPASFTIS